MAMDCNVYGADSNGSDYRTEYAFMADIVDEANNIRTYFYKRIMYICVCVCVIECVQINVYQNVNKIDKINGEKIFILTYLWKI